jgi:hypothetical protein
MNDLLSQLQSLSEEDLQKLAVFLDEKVFHKNGNDFKYLNVYNKT